jgi:hypothetical protein
MEIPYFLFQHVSMAHMRFATALVNLTCRDRRKGGGCSLGLLPGVN